jgi:CSLREA domain-containing protein
MKLATVRTILVLLLACGIMFVLPAAAHSTLETNIVLLDNFEGTTQGVAFGTPVYVHSRPGSGQAVELDTGDYIRYDLTGWYQWSHDYEPSGKEGTVELWVKAVAYPQSILIFQWHLTPQTPSEGYILGLAIGDDGRLVYNHWSSIYTDPQWGTIDQPVGNSVIPLNSWTHIAASWGPAGAKLYVNGALDGQSPDNAYPALNPALYIYVNAWGDATTGHKQIDELLISKVQRSDEEILADYQQPATFVVNTTTDSGDGWCDQAECTLREAISAANSRVVPTSKDTIAFNIPGEGPHTVRPTAPLPPLTDAVVIDGYTQPGAHPNTNPRGQGLNTLLKIELDGSEAGNVTGLVVERWAFGSTIRGLVIHHFSTGIYLNDSSGAVIEGNFIGTDVTGNLALGNGSGISALYGSGNFIGGSVSSAANLISGNGTGIGCGCDLFTIQGNLIGTDLTGMRKLGNGVGVVISREANNVLENLISGNDSHGIEFTSGHAVASLVQGNLIGTDVTGVNPLGNGGSGITGITGGAGNRILHNIIWGNGENGIATYNYGALIRNNSIFANSKLGIDNGNDGLTLNQLGGRPNFPILTVTKNRVGNNIVQTTLNGLPNTPYTVEFFANSGCDASGFGEGELFLDPPQIVTTDALGYAQAIFTYRLPADKPYVTAVSISPSWANPPAPGEGGASEFAQCMGPRQVVNYLLKPSLWIKMRYDPNDPRAPAGVFTMVATFSNRQTSPTLTDLFFRVKVLDYLRPPSDGGLVVLNADGGVGGVGYRVSAPGEISPGESFQVRFEIGLPRRGLFLFLVDAYGVRMGGLTAAALEDETEQESFRFGITEEQLQSGQETESYNGSIYLPLISN